jgi:hypothetical protein
VVADFMDAFHSKSFGGINDVEAPVGIFDRAQKTFEVQQRQDDFSLCRIAIAEKTA